MANENGDKEQVFSVTRLEMVQRCGVQAKYRYVDGITMPPGVAAVRGRGVHKPIAMNFREKVETRKDLPLDVLKDAAAQEVEAGFAGTVLMTEEERAQGVARVRGRAKDEAVKLVGVFAKEYTPGVQPKYTERRVQVAIPADEERGFEALNVQGVIDLIDDGDLIHDQKTSGKKPPKNAADVSQQLDTYPVLFRAAEGRRESGVALNTAVITEAGNTSFVQQRSVRSDAQLVATIDKMRIADRLLKSGIFLPTNPSNWWCSESWCGYWNICPYAGGRGRD